eukprot:TRINITY_DN65243_c0_g1_i1.p1 TRINITY_DN65243_c0_g1~~TRINITY_DN65243_c0_g1_i1.p1  ORF type:complete len:256 (-),score=12.36 TRINITY_DN65243_c0_g1_i1:343-1089(-)
MKKLVNWWIGGPDIEDCITAGFDDVTPPATPKRPWGWKPTKNKLLALVESLSTNASISVTCVANGTVIPHDVFSTILEFLGVLDVVTCMKVSRGWFCNSLDDNTWRMLFRRSFVHPQESSHTKNITANFKGRHFYSLFKRKTKIDRNSSTQVFSASRLTVEWSYRCPLSWYDLDPVANKPNVRHCSACDTEIPRYSATELKTGWFVPTGGCAFVAVGADVGDLLSNAKLPWGHMGKIAYTSPLPASEY